MPRRRTTERGVWPPWRTRTLRQRMVPSPLAVSARSAADPERLGPVAAGGQGRPCARSDPGGSCRIDAPESPAFVALVPGGSVRGRSSRWPPPPGLPTPGSPGWRERWSSRSASGRRPRPTGPVPPPPEPDARIPCTVPKARRPGCCLFGSSRRAAGPGGSPSEHPGLSVAFSAREGRRALVGDGCEERPAEGEREHGRRRGPARGQPTPIAASVFTSMRSMWLNLCWTRNEP